MNSMRRLTLPQRYNLATKRLEGRYVRFDIQLVLTCTVYLIRRDLSSSHSVYLSYRLLNSS